MPETEEEHIEIRSEEVQEILSHIPNWIIRWGITAILITVVAILISSWFIKYPDVITARVTITTPIPPVNIVAKSSGAIELMVTDGSTIKKGESLGVIDNSATTDDIFSLIKQCELFSKKEINKSPSFEESLNVGSVQTVYSQFIRSLADQKLFDELQYYDEQSNMLLSRIRHYEELNTSLRNQLSIQKRELGLAQENYSRDSLLFDSEATTKFEKNKTESILLQAKRGYQLSQSNIINNKIQIGQLQTQIADFKSKKLEQERNFEENIQQAFEQLESQLQIWKQNFLLSSPIDGTVSFSTYWSDNQHVNAGDEVMTIIPKETTAFGRVELPVSGSGKVEIGQRVNIKLDNYPYQEYGMVLGEIKTKSVVPNNNSYTLTLTLPNGLKSSYNKDLTFDREMQGNAEIITKDLRIIERVFNQFRSLIDNAG
jgi:multidrug resistance efflux pump